jgi:hypothetical protein
MVAKRRSRLVVDRLGALQDKPRQGQPRTISHPQLEQVITRTMRSAPAENHCSTGSSARELKITQTSVVRI